jgi:hypothetical protein
MSSDTHRVIVGSEPLLMTEWAFGFKIFGATALERI